MINRQQECFHTFPVEDVCSEVGDEHDVVHLSRCVRCFLSENAYEWFMVVVDAELKSFDEVPEVIHCLVDSEKLSVEDPVVSLGDS